MPTGYTSGVQDGTITSFRDYAKLCARAFGAFVCHRDDPFSPELPEITESSYYIERKENAERELQRCLAMTVQEAERESQEDFDRQKAEIDSGIATKAEQKRRYEAMLAKAKEFQPPTAEHLEYAKFLVDQLQSSIEFDCGGTYYEDRKNALRLLTPEEYREKKRHEAAAEYDRATTALNEERERVASRKQWVSQLLLAIDHVENGEQA